MPNQNEYQYSKNMVNLYQEHKYELMLSMPDPNYKSY